MNFKEYKKSEFERASKLDWFDRDGNNVNATSNRSYPRELLKQIKGLLVDVKSVDFMEIIQGGLTLILLLTLPLTFIPMALIRTTCSKKKADSEMLKSYLDHLNKKGVSFDRPN